MKESTNRFKEISVCPHCGAMKKGDYVRSKTLSEFWGKHLEIEKTKLDDFLMENDDSLMTASIFCVLVVTMIFIDAITFYMIH